MCCATGPRPSWSPPRPSAPTATAHSSPSPSCLRARGTTDRKKRRNVRDKRRAAGKNTYGSGDFVAPPPRTDSWSTAARAKASRKGRRRPWPAPATSFSRPAASLTRRELIGMSPTPPVVTLVCPHFSSDPRPAGRPRSLARIEMVVASAVQLDGYPTAQLGASSRPVALVMV